MWYLLWLMFSESEIANDINPIKPTWMFLGWVCCVKDHLSQSSLRKPPPQEQDSRNNLIVCSGFYGDKIKVTWKYAFLRSWKNVLGASPIQAAPNSFQPEKSWIRWNHLRIPTGKYMEVTAMICGPSYYGSWTYRRGYDTKQPRGSLCLSSH